MQGLCAEKHVVTKEHAWLISVASHATLELKYSNRKKWRPPPVHAESIRPGKQAVVWLFFQFPSQLSSSQFEPEQLAFEPDESSQTWRFVMSRPQLKLPKKVAHASTPISVISSVAAEHTSAVALDAAPAEGPALQGSPLPTPCLLNTPVTDVAASPADAGNAGSETTAGRLMLVAKKIQGPFRPVSMKYFITYAKNLSRLTDERMMSARETLAKIYGYRDLRELTLVLTEPGEAGPFDDVVPDDDWDAHIVQAALLARWEKAVGIIHSRIPRVLYDINTLCTSDNLQDMSLFSTPKCHLFAVESLDLPAFISESKSRRMDSEALASDEIP